MQLSHAKFCRAGKKTCHHPAAMTHSPEHLPVPSLSLLSVNLHFLPLLPAKDLSAASPTP